MTSQELDAGSLPISPEPQIRSAPSVPAGCTGALDRALQVVLAVALIGELGVVFANMLSRSVFGLSMQWANEPAEMALSTIAFLGGAFAYRRNEHAFIRLLTAILRPGVRRACQVLVDLLVLAISGTLAVSAVRFFIGRWGQLTPTLAIHVSWFALPLILSMGVLAVTAIGRLSRHSWPLVLGLGSGFSAVVVGLALTSETWQPWFFGENAVFLVVIPFLLSLFIGLPVGFALLLGGLAFFVGSGTIPIITFAQTTISGINNFVLLALPFFILAAVIMNDGGISLRLVRLVQVFVGHFRGGLLQVMVISMYVVSGLSGSKSADVAAVGSVMRDMLRRERYNVEQATAVLAASAVMGETVPPSIPMLVLGSVTSLSIGSLFIAGFIPAAVVGLCLMILIYLQARKSQAGRSTRPTLRQLGSASLSGILPLLMPVILIGGILLGVGTPTEVSSFAVIYGLVLAGFIYRELGFRVFLRGIIDCAAMSGMILFILAGASSFAWTLTIAQLPQRLVGLLGGVQDSRLFFILASIVLLIVTGTLLEGLPALVILAPILLPIAQQIGVSQLHFGIVLLIAMGIGAVMPPVGALFYVACAVCETTIEKSGRAMIPFLVVLCFALLLVALVPWFTLYLPMKFHLAG
jgi:tripartite ATP-independent transporter DctM subunit